jgi:hypothetical protein
MKKDLTRKQFIESLMKIGNDDTIIRIQNISIETSDEYCPSFSIDSVTLEKTEDGQEWIAIEFEDDLYTSEEFTWSIDDIKKSMEK